MFKILNCRTHFENTNVEMDFVPGGTWGQLHFTLVIMKLRLLFALI